MPSLSLPAPGRTPAALFFSIACTAVFSSGVGAGPSAPGLRSISAPAPAGGASVEATGGGEAAAPPGGTRADATGGGAAAAGVPARADDGPLGRPGKGRLPRIAVPRSYDLHFTVDPRRETFTGEGTLVLDLAAATDTIHLHALEMKSLSVIAETSGGKRITGAVSEAKGEGIATGDGEHVVTFPESLPAGRAVLYATWEAPYGGRLAGLYRAQENGTWYAYTQFESTDARRAFPCLDEPTWKVPFHLTLTVPEGMGAFANMPETSRTSEAGNVTVVFEPTPPLPTYLLAFAVGPFDVVEGPKEPIPIRGLAAKGKGPLLRESLAMHASLIRTLQDYFGRPFPFKKLDVVACLEFAAGAMENPGLITYREEGLLIDPATTSESRRRRDAATIAHELSHQWFGDLVTMSWWDDLWLNEAFAEWMSGKAVDATWPAYERRLSSTAFRDLVMTGDALSTARPVRGGEWSAALEGEAFGAATFKGAVELTMLEHWLGEDAFRKGVRSYLDAHAWGSATSTDLLSALETASGQEVHRVAATFLDRAGLPLVAATLDCRAGDTPAVTLRQSRYRTLASRTKEGFPEGGPWAIPVCVAYPAGDEVRTRCQLLDSETGRMTLDDAGSCPAWVHPNAGEYGYYRWSVPGAMLTEIASAVERPWPERVAAAGEAGTKGDAGASARAREASVSAEARERASSSTDTRATGGETGDPARSGVQPMQGTQLAPRSRLALLGQTWAMVSAGAIEPDAYLSVLESVSKDDDRRVIQQVLFGIQQIAETWEDLEPAPGFQSYVRRLLGPRASRLGWDPRPGEDTEITLLRPDLLRTLGELGHEPWVIDGAAAHAKAYLADPKSVSPELAGISLSLAASAGRLPVRKLVPLLSEGRPPAIALNALNALGNMPPGKELGRALDLMLSDKIRAQNTLGIWSDAMARPEARDQAFEFLRTHFDAMTKLTRGFGTLRGGSMLARQVQQFCSAPERDRAAAFFREKLGDGGSRPLERGLEAADRCIAIRRGGQASIASYFGLPGRSQVRATNDDSSDHAKTARPNRAP